MFVTHSVYEAAYLARRVLLITPRPGQIAGEIPLAGAITDRLSAAYAERVAMITTALRQLHLPA